MQYYYFKNKIKLIMIINLFIIYLKKKYLNFIKI